jgi:hypothetical protein
MARHSLQICEHLELRCQTYGAAKTYQFTDSTLRAHRAVYRDAAKGGL